MPLKSTPSKANERPACPEAIERRLLAHLERHLPADDAAFLEAQPFPHVVVDDFLPTDVCAFLEERGRGLRDLDDNTHLNSRKLAANRYWEFDAELRDTLAFFYSEAFEQFLERMTGIRGVHADYEFNWGGGFHYLPAGGFLKVHKDFNIHPYTNEHRRLNAILYLNRGWTDADGGQLELWDMETRECAASLVPIFNRLVIFETSENSYHGNPQRVTRTDLARMSYSLYYYTADRPGGNQIQPHSTVYVDRPGEYTNALRKWGAPLRRLLPDALRTKVRDLLNRS